MRATRLALESQRSPSSEGEGFARASRSPQPCHSQFDSQCLGVHVVPADLLDSLVMRPSFSSGGLWSVRTITCVG